MQPQIDYTAARERMRRYLETHDIPVGVGTEEGGACTQAAARLAIDGTLSDDPHPCISNVISSWVIRLQDRMPHDLRNGEWKEVAPQIIGTEQAHERERLDVILDWMWGTVLPAIQPVADRGGFGEQWSAMCRERTVSAAAAAATTAQWSSAAAVAARWAAADDAARWAADAAARWAAAIAIATADAADAVAAVADEFWSTVAPASVLRKLCAIGSAA